MGIWPLQKAKARFSEVIRKAAAEGPQEITVHGQQAAVVLSREDYTRLTRQQVPFVDFMRASPLVGIDLDLERDRDRSPCREVIL